MAKVLIKCCDHDHSKPFICTVVVKPQCVWYT